MWLRRLRIKDSEEDKNFSESILSFDLMAGRLCTVAMDRTIKNN